MQLTPQNVRRIFSDCLFTDDEVKGLNPGEAPTNAVIVVGITMKVGLNKDRLSKHKEEIKELLSQISDAPNEEGTSFLNIPFLKNKEQWGEHTSAQELMILGLASSFMKYCVPSPSMWKLLPGGVPYVRINLDGFQTPYYVAEEVS